MHERRAANRGSLFSNEDVGVPGLPIFAGRVVGVAIVGRAVFDGRGRQEVFIVRIAKAFRPSEIEVQAIVFEHQASVTLDHVARVVAVLVVPGFAADLFAMLVDCEEAIFASGEAGTNRYVAGDGDVLVDWPGLRMVGVPFSGCRDFVVGYAGRLPSVERLVEIERPLAGEGR